MNVQAMTPQQIRVAGLAALSRELGVVGMIRFMQQFEMGQGDYSKDRHQWLDQYSVDIAQLLPDKKTGGGDYTRDRKKLLPKKSVREIGGEIMKQRQSKAK
jgi:hypothetical protein